MNRHWTQDEIRWMRANVGRVDLQSASRALGIPLVEVEKMARELQAESAASVRKPPSTHREAARELSHAHKLFEKGMEHLHRREMEPAARCFSEVVELHPDEHELVDRARTYLLVASNGRREREKPLRDPVEIYHAAVYEKNRGNCLKALELVQSVNGHGDPDGRLAYLAACCLALNGRPAEAVERLHASIEASSQNRIQARLEADLASLRSEPLFEALVGRG
jgi:hypothetical protein